MLTGIVAVALVGAVTLGGIRRIGATAERIVPTMAIAYVVAALIILILYASAVPGAIVAIVRYAFETAASLAPSCSPACVMASRAASSPMRPGSARPRLPMPRRAIHRAPKAGHAAFRDAIKVGSTDYDLFKAATSAMIENGADGIRFINIGCGPKTQFAAHAPRRQRPAPTTGSKTGRPPIP